LVDSDDEATEAVSPPEQADAAEPESEPDDGAAD